jgi:CRISPR-associated protein Cas2
LNVLITYDVNTQTDAGRKRLHMVAKICEGYGVRVQSSVFEFDINRTSFERLKHRLLGTIDIDKDSLRIYFLRGSRKSFIETHGIDHFIDLSGPLVI